MESTRRLAAACPPVLLLLALAACERPAPNEPMSLEPGGEYTMRVGEQAFLRLAAGDSTPVSWLAATFPEKVSIGTDGAITAHQISEGMVVCAESHAMERVSRELDSEERMLESTRRLHAIQPAPFESGLRDARRKVDSLRRAKDDLEKIETFEKCLLLRITL